ncbi:MAG: hypothetical protein GEU79_11450 [Acidimicrobiia bacterium]|nr:hypothetical protein [Acidimicrobiia bacterium]
MAPRLFTRADLKRFYCHPSGLQPLANEEAFVRSGISAAAEHNADIIARDVIEEYVSQVALDLLEADEPRARRAGAQLLEAPHSPNATITAADA